MTTVRLLVRSSANAALALVVALVPRRNFCADHCCSRRSGVGLPQICRVEAVGATFALRLFMIAHQSVVWLDHQEARIFSLDAEKLQAETVAAPEHHLHRHPKGAAAEHQHPNDSAQFFRHIATVLRDAGQVLLVGPSTTKLQFLRFLAKQDHALEAKIVGIETVDHPTDRQLVAHARHYFDPKNYPRG